MYVLSDVCVHGDVGQDVGELDGNDATAGMIL